MEDVIEIIVNGKTYVVSLHWLQKMKLEEMLKEQEKELTKN
jgi:hypothetical protein